jgi:hypothetical protein
MVLVLDVVPYENLELPMHFSFNISANDRKQFTSFYLISWDIK